MTGAIVEHRLIEDNGVCRRYRLPVCRTIMLSGTDD